jgi:hypothetical protein
MGDQKIDAGSLVENTLKPDWGPGKVVHANDEYIFVIFRDLPHREAKQFLRQDNPLHLAKSQSDLVLFIRTKSLPKRVTDFSIIRQN